MTAPPPPLPDSVPVEGRRHVCRMCGHPLRDRVSLRWGLGPDCRRKMRLRYAADPGRFTVQQDGLFET
ncbi:DUF6011 domain-containing protein [Streptomyces sp. NPDC054784]